jgi:hypothetical protein
MVLYAPGFGQSFHATGIKTGPYLEYFLRGAYHRLV